MFSRNPAAGATELPFSGDKIKRADFWRTKVPVCICRLAACLLFTLASQFWINSTLFTGVTRKVANDEVAAQVEMVILANGDTIATKTRKINWQYLVSRGNYSYNRSFFFF